MSSRVGVYLAEHKGAFCVCFLALEHMCVSEEHAVLREPPVGNCSCLCSVIKSLLALQAERETEHRLHWESLCVCCVLKVKD